MSSFALQSRLLANMKQELEDQSLQLSPYCEQQIEHLINTGINRMVINKATEMPDKINLADENLKRLIEYLAEQAKYYGFYPNLEELGYDLAMAGCFPLWPYC